MKKGILFLLSALIVFGSMLSGCETAEPSETEASTGGSEALTEPETEAEATEEPTEEAMQPEAYEQGKYRFEALKEAGAARLLGRTRFVGGKMTVDWSGCGVLMRVRTEGETMTIQFENNYGAYFSIEVDGKETAREHADGQGFIRIPLEAGEHTVSVIKDTEISIRDKSFSYLNYVKFSGEFLKAPAEKQYFIEVIGDSIACGDGALGVFTPGVEYTLAEHSAKASFGYVAAEVLGADVSMVTRGGIGLLKARDEFSRRMIDIYEYVSPYYDRESYYDFSERFPDLVILELGANDGSYTAEEWVPALDEMVKMIRSRNGVVPILWVGKSTKWHQEVLKYIDENNVTDMFAMYYAYGTSGSGSPATASHGHPNADEQYQMGVAVAAFIDQNDLLKPKTCFIPEEEATRGSE